MTRSLEPVLRVIAEGFAQSKRDLQAQLLVLERIADALAELGVKNGEH